MGNGDQTVPGQPGRSGAPLPPIRFAELATALLDMGESLLQQWLPGGVRRGPEYVCGSLQGGDGGSCLVSLTNGRWGDFASGEQGGDWLSLYAAIEGLTMGKAALQVAREYGLEDVAGVQKLAEGATQAKPARPPRPPAPPKPPEREREQWSTIVPVPSTAPPPPFKHEHRSLDDIIHTATYGLGDDVHGYVVRFRTSDGGKETLPYTWCNGVKWGGARWHWRTWDVPRPLYLPGHTLPGERTVVLVEGEIKAEVLQVLLDAGAPGVYCVASWPGGSSAWEKADWAWLAGCTVLMWPDCDAKRHPLSRDELKANPDRVAQAALKLTKPLMAALKQPSLKAMHRIGPVLRDAHGCTVQLLAIPAPGEKKDGWDCRDAIEADGWDFERVLSFFGTAYALPVEAEAEAAKPAVSGSGDGGKKIDGPAEAGDGDSGGASPAREIPWWLLPYWVETKNKSYWAVSRKLVISALRHDDQLKGILGLNELTNNVDARRPWPWLHGLAGPIKGSTSLMLGQYLSDSYGLPSIPVAALEEAITTVAQSSRFHPVRTYLQGLRHDGITRIDKWLIHVLGESPATLPAQMVEYLGLVGRFLLQGMVWRVMEPGCKFDYCAVLEGPGGLGKSTFVKTLATKPFFSDAHFDLTRGKEGQEQVQGVWLYELQELSSLGKAELNLIKAFISSEDDRYRQSYGRTVETFPRQCVMVGTTNEDRYLRDRTGNRRWWPVPVRHIVNNPWLDKMRDQLLAEAFALYGQGVRYTPTREQEAKLFEPMQESRLEESAVQSELMHVLTRAPVASGIGAIVNELADFVTNSQLCQALGVDAAKSGPSLVREVGSWMKHQGWEQKKKTINNARVLGYVRPHKWPQCFDDDALAVAEDWTAGLLAPTPPPMPSTGTTTTQDDDDAPF